MRLTMFRYPVLTALFISFLTISSCIKDEIKKDEKYDVAGSYNLQNIAYGNDAQQKMDIYLPANRSADSTKVFILIHGGGWSGGDKADYTSFLNSLKTLYPNYGVVNLNYRLATSTSPGYPKQIDDIKAAISEIQKDKYGLSKQYFLIGASAGGHLAMLYGYAFDANHHVKAICNTVGPADLTDSAYTQNPVLMGVIAGLTGNVTYAQNPSLFAEVSPAKQVTPLSPKTISFYGDIDPLIPSSQMGRLHSALDAKGVYNEKTMYAGEGHGGWNATNTQDAVTKLINFINRHF